ncbi:hypothetical protein A3F29_01020 [Candidatus Roizmanbacteria bacterium RIFCSPHIGHO2_12_FULL_33_9]|uniref:M23ase beta-sheet core domain-containing protein n=1 Tax=Candidatus Roizmanbacteria bacterium RIFCSPHIGHO2_12_FULL_33_9 TaxID=1802045 RepID=A0A1F7HIU2_9BACT|nr:MAG: hypothetical protein A3F29_01020 [Candidatus Roizmanbacteria bacterium RIFCSPHIGHO2_12_FULL_33_9]
MKILKIFITSLAILLLFFVVFNRTAEGQVCGSKEECERLISETEQKLSAVRSQKTTLASQIQFMDTQIYLTTLKIQDTQQQIKATEEEIETLGGRIEGVNDSLDYLTKLLFNKIKEGYKRRDVPLFSVLLDSDNASTLVNQLKYAQIAQENDRRVAFQLQQAKKNFEDQKDLREQKVTELLSLRSSLNQHNADLGNQRAQKQDLLRVTQNDERNFQILLARLRADAASINVAIGNVGVKIGPVNKGDVIASVGSTGCSTGPHLHFEVFTDAKVEEGRIVGNRVDPVSYLENSNYERPVPGYPGSVTTWYGTVYFLGTHTGIDIAQPFGTPIKAIDSGESYYTSAPCSYNIIGGSPVGKGIIVDHKNGLVTLYWHIP